MLEKLLAMIIKFENFKRLIYKNVLFFFQLKPQGTMMESKSGDVDVGGVTSEPANENRLESAMQTNQLAEPGSTTDDGLNNTSTSNNQGVHVHRVQMNFFSI